MTQNPRIPDYAPKAPKARAKPVALRNADSKVAVTIRVPAVLRAKFLRLANADGRTLNNWIVKQLQDNSK